MNQLRPLLIVLGLLGLWQTVVVVTAVPKFLLPPPSDVLWTALGQWSLLLGHARVTLVEILLGLVLGVGIGAGSALVMALLPPLQPWLLPLLILGQTIPVFALAPLLVLWFGYGLWSKVAMAALIIYFPVAAALFDGLRRTEPGWLDLARTMNATRLRTLFRLRLPAALPVLGSGLRIATAVAPIGAVVGEWVGSSAGLGYLMLHANARLRIDLMFAALLVLILIALGLYLIVDRLVVRAVPWAPHHDSPVLS